MAVAAGAFPISLTMPLEAAEIEPTLFAPWAANLLPEAAQLNAVGRRLGVAPGDVIGLLAEIAPSLQRVRRLAEAVLGEAAGAREEVQAMPGAARPVLTQCEDSVTRRAGAILAGLDDQTGASVTSPHQRDRRPASPAQRRRPRARIPPDRSSWR